VQRPFVLRTIRGAVKARLAGDGAYLGIVPSFKIFTFLAYPFVKILTGSSRLLLRLMHTGKSESRNLSDADLKNILSLAYRQGTLEKEELILHENIFNFYEQSVQSMMTPLEKVISVQITMTEEEVGLLLRGSTHNYFPVILPPGSYSRVSTSKVFFDRAVTLRRPADHVQTLYCPLLSDTYFL
jgi:putative hemolysin